MFFLLPKGFQWYTPDAIVKRLNREPSPEVRTMGTISSTTSANSFEQPYIDNESVSAFVARVAQTCDMYYKDDSTYFSPYFTMFQSSCWGKSRLLREVLYRHVPGIYISLMRPDSTGFPKRSLLADTLLLCKSEQEYIDFVGAVLDFFCAVFDEQGSTADVCRCMDAWRSVQADETKFAKEIDSRMRSRRGKPLPQLPVPNWLFVFDEARALLVPPSTDPAVSHFRFLRRAFASRFMSMGVVAVFSDTLSRISNFAPTTDIDPSARIVSSSRRNGKGTDLFAPFFVLATCDVLAETTPPASLAQALEPRHLLSLGRPIWKAYFNDMIKRGGETVAVVSSILWFANGKLCPPEASLVVSAMACLSCRLLLNVCPGDQLAVTLVWSHMATCVGVSPERDRLVVRYPSEPILAEAAAFQWYQFTSSLGKYLDELLRLMQTGTIDAGHRGELVARLMLLLAFDRYCLNDSASPFKFSRPVPLVGFLDSLFGAQEWKLPSELNKAAVCFTHFEFLDCIPSRELLEKALFRCAALICKQNAPIIDLIIPLLLGDKVTVSAVVVQVKNHQTQFESKWPDSATIDLTLDAAATDLPEATPFVSLYMQLGAPRQKLCCAEYGSQFMVVALGLSESLYPVLSKAGVYEQVAALLRPFKLELYYPEQALEQRILRHFYPLSHPVGFFMAEPKEMRSSSSSASGFLTTHSLWEVSVLKAFAQDPGNGSLLQVVGEITVPENLFIADLRPSLVSVLGPRALSPGVVFLYPWRRYVLILFFNAESTLQLM